MQSEDSSAPRPDETAETIDLRKQQTAFSILTLFVLALLLLLHTLAASVLGEPSLPVIGVLGLSFALRVVELVWLQTREAPLVGRSARIEGAISIVSLFVLAALLAWLTNRDRSPYEVLLAIPVLQSACLFGATATVLTILTATAAMFLWQYHYFALHPPALAAEYVEVSMLAIVFALMGMLVWFLISQLRANEQRLAGTLTDLRSARERLMREERLAAIGRLASGIAHEIRNPVAMIMSALTTAADPSIEDKEREEMFAIAGRQAGRLESLTTDFLSYARPSVPRRLPVTVHDLLSAIVAVTRVRAAERGIEVVCTRADPTVVFVDASQIEGALLNLTLNAIDALPDSGTIKVAGELEAGVLRIHVENSGPPIPDTDLGRIFEPFFTTKSGGTGLGLAIARGIARAHGGDLWVSENRAGQVIFTMTVGAYAASQNEREVVRGPGPDRG